MFNVTDQKNLADKIKKNSCLFSFVPYLTQQILDLFRAGGGAQWAKSEGEAVLLQFSGFTKDPMHDFNRFFC